MGQNMNATVDVVLRRLRHKAKDVSLPLHHYKASLSLFASMCVFLGRADCDNEEGEESGFCELDLKVLMEIILKKW
ncbi:hypothetical protein YC2023_118314 [Brassica napus]